MDEICGKPYTQTFHEQEHTDLTCLRDKGHDDPDYIPSLWPPPKTEEERADRIAAYREHGYEDRTAF